MHGYGQKFKFMVPQRLVNPCPGEGSRTGHSGPGPSQLSRHLGQDNNETASAYCIAMAENISKNAANSGKTSQDCDTVHLRYSTGSYDNQTLGS